MPQTITNQARVSYQFNDRVGSALSNIATAVLNDPLSAAKNSVESEYRPGDTVTFAISFVNSGAALTNVTVTDDLGTYAIGTGEETPLTFVSPALLYINGVYSGNPVAAVSGDSVVFTVPSVPAGANAVIVYNALVNDAAPLAVGSQITNTATISADGLTVDATASNTITAEEYADIRITKAMTPTGVVDGSQITYDFTVYNYGNTEATGIVLTDRFDPAPTGITVFINGDVVDPADYTYAGGLLTLPAGSGTELSLPAATLIQDPVTGEITVVPSTLDITVTGTL